MCHHSNQLLTIDQVPRFLRYNYYIRSGYRHPPQTVASAPYHVILSIFSWHNESVNIWTHLFGLIMFVFILVYEFHFRDTQDIRYCVVLTCIAFVFTFSGSIMYHSGMNKCSCEKQYRQCLKYDVMGVICALTLSAISPIINGYKCNYGFFAISALIILIASFCYISIKIFAPNATAKVRGKYIGIHVILRTILALSMVSGNVLWRENRYQSLKWHLISFVLLLIGGAINVSRYPEKLFVNKYLSSFFLLKQKIINGNECEEEQYNTLLDFIRYSIDFIGNSHIIWHIFVVFAGVACYYGCVWDSIYSLNTVCSNDDLYDLEKRTHVDINQIDNNNALYVVALDLIFDPKFLYPF